MSATELGAALTPVLDALTTLGVSHYVCGSLASSAHGVPRASIDADLVADVRPEQVAALIDALTGRYYVPEDRVRQAVRDGTSFSVIHLASMMKVDVFVVAESAVRQEELTRAGRARLDDGREFPVASVEDTLLAKLDWFRQGGEVSERQWTDVLGLLRMTTNLDQQYLERSASARGVVDLLERARRESRSS